MFRDNIETFLRYFSSKIGVCIHFKAGLHGTIFSIKYANYNTLFPTRHNVTP